MSKKRRGLQTKHGTMLGGILSVEKKDEKYHGASMLLVDWKGECDVQILAHALYRNHEAEDAVRAVGLDPGDVWKTKGE